MKNTAALRSSSGQRGGTLVLMALFTVFVMSAAALAVDLGLLYVSRSEAQRAADAAALSGAYVFTTGCTNSGSCLSASTEQSAAQKAIATAKANFVAGAQGSVDCDLSGGYSSSACSGIQFTDPSGTGQEPQITVTVKRTGIPLFFAKLFGVQNGTVSAAATAEANSTGGAQQCVAPFLVPNCDPDQANNTLTAHNSTCSGSSSTGYGGFVVADPSTFASTVANPGPYDPNLKTPGVYGEPWTLHYAYPPTTGSAAGSVVPSQWSMASFPTATGQVNNGTNLLVAYIQSCPPVGVGCGTQLQLNPGNDPTSIDGAINSLIEPNVNCSGNGKCGSDGPGNGQDYLLNVQNSSLGQYPQLQSNSGCPENSFPFASGSNPANIGCTGQTPTNSVMLAPIYQGNTLTPGCSPTTSCTVTVVGFIELFIDYSQKISGSETVQTNILNVLDCGALKGNGTTVSAGASPIPIRLIQHAN
jgi:Flp pilus assembly protein TadG